jgi:hypothetical protein
MYHVLMAFSLINACLGMPLPFPFERRADVCPVIFAFIALLTLATRRHLNGDYHMWYGPVTAGMVNNYSKSKPPSRRAQAAKPSILPTVMTERRKHSAPSRHKPTHSSSRRAHPVADRYTRHQGGSGQSSLIGSNEFDNGGMVNPNRRPSK